MFKANDMVEFATLNADEAPCVYRVVEANGDRCIVEAQVELPIKPTMVVLTADLVPAK